MKQNLWTLLVCLCALPAYSQLDCNNVKASILTYSVTDEVTLVNSSVPYKGNKLGFEMYIEWGDNTTTTYNNSYSATWHKYASPGTYTVKLAYTVYDSVYNITCRDTTLDTVVVTTIDCDTLKASFQASINKDTITLVNTSTPKSGIYLDVDYHITWGNSSGRLITSQYGPYTYGYKNAGTYNVSMAVILKGPFTTCRDTVDTTVTVIPPNEISGIVNVDSSLTLAGDSLKILLLSYNSSSKLLNAVDSFITYPIKNFPVYRFYNRPPGIYIVRAEIVGSRISKRGNIPTYRDSKFWDSSQKITHTGNYIKSNNIYMRVGKVTSGPGKVEGVLRHTDTGGSTSPVPNMNVLLLDASRQAIAYAKTDTNGAYSFVDLPNGSYTIHPENINFTTTAATVNISAGQVSHTGVNFMRYSNPMVIVPDPVSIADVNEAAESFTIAPNPAKETVTLKWSIANGSRAAITIADVQGRPVYTGSSKTADDTIIDIGGLPAGAYFLTVQSDKGSNTQQLIIE